MLRYYRCTPNKLLDIPDCEPECLITLIEPTAEEISSLREHTGIHDDVIADGLDPDERPHIETEPDCTYVVFRAPWVDGNELREDFTTPITLVFTGKHITLISPHRCGSLNLFFSDHGERHINASPVRIMACLFRTIAERYLYTLREINANIKKKEHNLGSLDRQDQLKLLHVQNCLIYFQAALRGNELILERLLNNRLHVDGPIMLTPDTDDIAILDDCLTNIRQGAYTASIYAEIMGSLMQAHSTALGARVNTAMKVLTALTLVLMIPTLVTSAYGMNVPLPLQGEPAAFLMVAGLSVFSSMLSIYMLWKRGWFSTR